MATYNFGAQVRAIAEKNKVRVETVVRKTVVDMAARMIRRSPVDTGRFRANWVFGQGGANASPGADSVAAVTGAISAAAIGGHWMVTNSLPYAYRLEHGWSAQAPAGMVRVTLAEFQGAFNSAVGAVK